MAHPVECVNNVYKGIAKGAERVTIFPLDFLSPMKEKKHFQM